MIKHMCVSREAGFCAATNNLAIAISQTIIARPKIQVLYCYLAISILEQKIF